MPAPSDLELESLRQTVNRLTQRHYPDDAAPAALAAAALRNDTAYLHARAQLAEAERDAALLKVSWMSPTAAIPPKDALARIKALCGYWPDLYDTLQAVAATHPTVGRDILARAIKQFRADTGPYSIEDLTSMLIAAWNGGRQGFDAVVRTRRSSERKGGAGGLPWAHPDHVSRAQVASKRTS